MGIALVILALLVALVVAYGVYGHWARPSRKGIEAPTIIPEAGQYTVVLAHGLLGFDHLRTPAGRQFYFRGIADHLRDHGVAVHTARVPPLGTVPERAAKLKASIDELGSRRVVIIGHSMGGLDARYAISKLGLAERVAALVTVGTPHRGSCLANHADRLPARTLRSLLGRLGLTTDALAWLGEAPAKNFNEQVLDASNVRYGSIVGETHRRQILANPILLASFELLRQLRGPNDCLVPASSQRWGKEVRVVAAHHLAQIGWSPRFDASAMYMDIVRQWHAGGLPCVPRARPAVVPTAASATR